MNLFPSPCGECLFKPVCEVECKHSIIQRERRYKLKCFVNGIIIILRILGVLLMSITFTAVIFGLGMLFTAVFQFFGILLTKR